MFHRECIPTNAVGWQERWCPAIPEEDCVSECSLMQGEAHVLDGQCCQPGGGAFLPGKRWDLCWLAERTSFRFCRSSFCLYLPFLTLQNVSAFSDLLLSGSAVLGDLVNIEQS